jgi:preprotein translocase subunit YajC
MHSLSFLLLQAAAPSGPASNPALQFLPVILIGAIFYFLVFMPMQRQKKQQAQMLAGLEAGSEVVTTGGIVGTVVNISGDMLVIRVKPDNLKLQITRSAVSGMLNNGLAAGEKK